MLNRRVCGRCLQWHEQPWDEDEWREGYVDCPRDLVVNPRIKDLKVRRMLGTVFGMTETSEIPDHCPHAYEHEEACV